jgi:hypothetical protein
VLLFLFFSALFCPTLPQPPPLHIQHTYTFAQNNTQALPLFPMHLLFASCQAPLSEVLEKIVSHRIHRVYIVDESECPVGVVTCTDVLRLLVKVTQPELDIGSGGAAPAPDGLASGLAAAAAAVAGETSGA